jgi:hypothetical protein
MSATICVRVASMNPALLGFEVDGCRKFIPLQEYFIWTRLDSSMLSGRYR